MKKKCAIIIILLISLILKSYLNINYSNAIEADVIDYAGYGYGYGYTCVHEYKYENYDNAENHKVSCSICGSDLGTQEHDSVYCCQNGNKCSKCGYTYGHNCLLLHEHSYDATYIIKNSLVHKSYCLCNEYIEESHQIVDGYCTLCGYGIEVFPGVIVESPTANNPMLPEVIASENVGENTPANPDGMIPIKWVESEQAWYITDVNDYEWYDYDNDIWANITLRDGLVVEGANGSTGTLESLVGKKVTTMGSMFVWVPRYTYKNNGNGDVSICFSKGTNDYTEDGYSLAPAFYYGTYLGGDSSNKENYKDRDGKNNELSGIWVAKFMASIDGTHINVKPNASIYTSDVNTLFDAAKNMVADETYGLNLSQVSTHMMKASEWASVAYLTAGIEKTPYINNTQKTGYGGATLNALSTDESYLWNTTQGQKASTTNNATGIFDMSGAVNEYIAGIISINNNSIVSGSISQDYENVDIINATNTNNIGISILNNYKLALADVINWDNDEFVLPTATKGVLNRGGNYQQAESAGIYALNASTGRENYGFRPVIVVKNTVKDDSFAMFETEKMVISGESVIINLQFTLKESSWKLNKELSKLFTPDATTGERSIDMYVIEKGTEDKIYNLNHSVVGIAIDDREMSESQLMAITKDTVFGAGTYQIRIAIGGTYSGVPVFKKGVEYKVYLGEVKFLQTNGAAISIVPTEKNVVNIQGL